MAMFRVQRRLAVSKERYLLPGTFSRLEWIDEAGIERLIMRGSVSRIKAPPLAVLPNWKRRGAKLSDIGIEDAEQFLEADVSVVAEKLGVKPETVNHWKTEVEGWLTVTEIPVSG